LTYQGEYACMTQRYTKDWITCMHQVMFSSDISGVERCTRK
jgi:hypothetical protein